MNSYFKQRTKNIINTIMKKYILLITLFTLVLTFGMTCYMFDTARYIFSPIFIITYLIICSKFLKPKELRMNKLKFLAVPTILITICSILFLKATLFFTSIFGAYIVSVGIKNWLKMKLMKD